MHDRRFRLRALVSVVAIELFGLAAPRNAAGAAATHFAVSAPGSATAGSAFNFTVIVELDYRDEQFDCRQCSGRHARRGQCARVREQQAYVQANQPPPTFADSPFVPGSTQIRAQHLSQLRAAVIALEGL